MEIKTQTLGPFETQFFAWAQLTKSGEVRTGDLVKAMKLTKKQEGDLLYNLSSSSLILKLWRGFYLIPERIPPGGRWSPSPYLIINQYMREHDAKYQISGPAVFNSYGFSTQLASEFTIYNNKVSKKVSILQYRFAFVKVAAIRLGNVQEFMPSGASAHGKAIFSSPEQALLDAVFDYKRFGSLPRAFGWIESSIRTKRIDPVDFAKVVVLHGNTMSKKRIGWLLEKLGLEKKIYTRILRQIPKTKFLVPLDPNNSNGPIDEKWGVIENVKICS